MAKMFSIQDFNRRFPTNEACLEHIFRIRYGRDPICPKCQRPGKFYKLAKEPAYSCEWCGHHIHPMVGTPFTKSRTPLTKWFYAMYLFAMSRHGVPAKELQRQLGITYKAAWRMGHEIRKYMAIVDGNNPLGGHVEIDETLIGGKEQGVHNRGRGSRRKVTVMGMLARGGNLMTKIVPNVQRAQLFPHILGNVKPGSTVSTDELTAYKTLAMHGFNHGAVSHAREEWVRGIHHVNSVEGVWSIIKRSIRGTHVHVSRRHLSKYLGEFEYRYNMRKRPEFMFQRLLLSFVPAS